MPWPKSKHRLNLEAFTKPLTAEAKYWVGFLLADGCVSAGSHGYGTVCLRLKFSDAEHVRKFARFVGVLEESVREYTEKSTWGYGHGVQLQFAGKELVGQLAEYNVIPRKSGKEVVEESLALDPDFWRGMLDGDGSLSMVLRKPYPRPYPWITLCGSNDVVSRFVDYLFVITGFKPSISSCRSIFQTALAGKKARVAISNIYPVGCDPVLERKMVLAKAIIDWRSKDE